MRGDIGKKTLYTKTIIYTPRSSKVAFGQSKSLAIQTILIAEY